MVGVYELRSACAGLLIGYECTQVHADCTRVARVHPAACRRRTLFWLDVSLLRVLLREKHKMFISTCDA